MDSSDTPPTSPSAIPPAPSTPMPESSISAPSMPPPPAPGSPPPSVTQAGGSSKKPMMIAIIIVLIIAILAAGGFYYYQMMVKNSETSETTTTETSSENKDLENLNSEVQDVQISDPEAGLSAVDQEINLLDASASAKPASGSALLNSR